MSLNVIALARIPVHEGLSSAKRMTWAVLLAASSLMYYLLYMLNEALLIL